MMSSILLRAFNYPNRTLGDLSSLEISPSRRAGNLLQMYDLRETGIDGTSGTDWFIQINITLPRSSESLQINTARLDVDLATLRKLSCKACSYHSMVLIFQHTTICHRNLRILLTRYNPDGKETRKVRASNFRMILL
jgi:hypothetical protein